MTIDVASGAEAEVNVGAGVKFNPAYVGGRVACLRKDAQGTGAGIYYAGGARGPKGDVRAASWSPDGTDVHQLTDNQWEDGTPAWQPKRPPRVAAAP